jgi:hypothetical protein
VDNLSQPPVEVLLVRRLGVIDATSKYGSNFFMQIHPDSLDV